MIQISNQISFKFLTSPSTMLGPGHISSWMGFSKCLLFSITSVFQERGPREGQSKQVSVCFGFFQTLSVMQQTQTESVLYRPTEGHVGTMPVISQVSSLIGKDSVMDRVFPVMDREAFPLPHPLHPTPSICESPNGS